MVHDVRSVSNFIGFTVLHRRRDISFPDLHLCLFCCNKNNNWWIRLLFVPFLVENDSEGNSIWRGSESCVITYNTCSWHPLSPGIKGVSILFNDFLVEKMINEKKMDFQEEEDVLSVTTRMIEWRDTQVGHDLQEVGRKFVETLFQCVRFDISPSPPCSFSWTHPRLDTSVPESPGYLSLESDFPFFLLGVPSFHFLVSFILVVPPSHPFPRNKEEKKQTWICRFSRIYKYIVSGKQDELRDASSISKTRVTWSYPISDLSSRSCSSNFLVSSHFLPKPGMMRRQRVEEKVIRKFHPPMECLNLMTPINNPPPPPPPHQVSYFKNPLPHTHMDWHTARNVRRMRRSRTGRPVLLHFRNIIYVSYFVWEYVSSCSVTLFHPLFGWFVFSWKKKGRKPRVKVSR